MVVRGKKWLNCRVYAFMHSSVVWQIINVATMKLVLRILSLFIFPGQHRTWILLYTEARIISFGFLFLFYSQFSMNRKERKFISIFLSYSLQALLLSMLRSQDFIKSLLSIRKLHVFYIGTFNYAESWWGSTLCSNKNKYSVDSLFSIIVSNICLHKSVLFWL